MAHVLGFCFDIAVYVNVSHQAWKGKGLHDGFIYLHPNEQSRGRLDEHVAVGTNYV